VDILILGRGPIFRHVQGQNQAPTRFDQASSCSTRSRSATAQAAYSSLSLHLCVTQVQIREEICVRVDFTLLSTTIWDRFQALIRRLRDKIRHNHAGSSRLKVSAATAQAAYSWLTLHPCVNQIRIRKEISMRVDFTLLSFAI
jgi:hypothetical protein